VDNWFNSPKLLQHLKANSTYGLGTVRKTRKGLPKLGKKLAKGKCESYVCDGLILERWQDRREVLMLNSFMDHGMSLSISANPANQRYKPKSVLWYNKNMSGVDFIDKQIAPYKITRKSVKWYKKMAFHLIELAVHNSFLVYQHYHPTKKITFKEFLLRLVQEILERNRLVRKRKINHSTASSENSKSGLHMPERVISDAGKPIKSNCHFCYKRGKRTQTSFICSECTKRFCIQGRDSCFKLHHQGTTSIQSKQRRAL